MNQETLKQILSTKYDRALWRSVLTDVFGVRELHQNPRTIPLPKNEIAASAVELGSFETSDGRLVGLYQVDLTNTPRIWQNRVGLRSLLRSVYKHDVDAALVVFVQNDKWRLSLISEIIVRDADGNITEQKTEPKRYTYLLGKDETVRTTRDRLFQLAGTNFDLEELIDTFSVEKLTKAFFKTYKDLFGKFCEHLADSASYRELFLGSKAKLEKGWQDPAGKPIRDFVKILLGRLVFLQFLQKKGWMGVPDGQARWENGDPNFLQTLFANSNAKAQFHSKVLRTLFFETLNRKRNHDRADSILGDDIRTPYLNGGLFDNDISAGNVIDFPQKLFAELLDFFQQYNFTIDEDDPYDREVGIDPEMLGHIFENLLEENREKGAFYTPKEIVHYMCQESLVEYLATHLPDSDRPAIEQLVRTNQLDTSFTNRDKAIEVDKLLRDVKICDPAIGSGAFPMGLLREIFECRRLLYPYLKTNESFDPASIKKEIIQNNIYGVDIDNGAVEIARLRFWLSLVVDEIEPSPLPNLDYKIMQGNSLLEQFDDISLVFDKSKLSEDYDVERNLFGDAVNPQISLMDVLRTQQELGEFDVTKLETEFFGTDDAQRKAHIREQLNRLERLVIARAIKAKAAALRSDIRKVNKEIETKQASLRSAAQRDSVFNSAIGKKLRKLEAQLEKVEESKERLRNIRPDNKPYFLWHLYFQDVFERGGFDIVIGNPPYGFRNVMKKAEKEFFRKNLKVEFPTGDIAELFFYISLNSLVKVDGVLTFIIPKKSLYGESWQLVRKVWLNHDLIFLMDASKAFEKVLLEQTAFSIRNRHTERKISIGYLDATQSSVKVLGDYPRESIFTPDLRNAQIYKGLFPTRLLKKIDANSKLSTDRYVRVEIGISNITQHLTFEANGNHPCVKGIDIVNYGHKGSERYLKGKIARQHLRDYAHEKVIAQEIIAHVQNPYPRIQIIAFFDEIGRLYNDTCVEIISLNGEYSIKFLLGYFQSKFCNWYCYNLIYNRAIRTMHFINYYVTQIPLPIANKDQKKQIEDVVENIIEERRTNPEVDITAYQRQLDSLIYGLFTLSREEIEIVEGRSS